MQSENEKILTDIHVRLRHPNDTKVLKVWLWRWYLSKVKKLGRDARAEDIFVCFL